jgi:prepilin-type N-terminal cleavage/methylation domain-containing protein
VKANKAVARTGFTLVELSVVILVIGVLAVFTLPKIKASVERAKAIEAFNYMTSVRMSQDRYHAKKNTYAANIADLDIQMTKPKYFTFPAQFTAGMTGDLEDSWTLTLTRSGGTAGYGAYSVTFTEAGLDTENSDIPDDINPMGT